MPVSTASAAPPKSPGSANTVNTVNTVNTGKTAKTAKTVTPLRRCDYRPPEFGCERIELTFDLSDDATVVSSRAHYRRLRGTGALRLDGEELTFLEARVTGHDCRIEVRDDALVVADPPGDFWLELKNRISPVHNTELMGLYKSGAIFCTQCEPMGFRRITYFLDRPDVLSSFKVTLLAPPGDDDGVLLSNGNLIESGTRESPDGSVRRYAVWEDPFAKPCYLFALVAGPLDELADTYVTSSGRRVGVAVYVERGQRSKARFALSQIKEAMRWDEQRFGLEYDLDNFKVVAVDFFNQGAMENKSLNIFNSKLVLVDERSATDADFYRVQGVIGHEYFHNYTGDRVTLRDWFQLSLKESLTVFRDQEFSSDVASRSLTRLVAVRLIQSRQFAEDASPMAHPVRPERVTEMNNFYTVTIYDKGAEVIRMIHTLLGETRFQAAVHDYLTRFDGQAATIDDFVACCARAGKPELTGQFMRWYTQSGTPRLEVRRRREGDRLILSFTQSPAHADDEPFLIPVRLSFISKTGHRLEPPEMAGREFVEISARQQDLSFTVPAGTLPLLLKDFSAPVKLAADYSGDELQQLLSFADDAFLKSFAARELTLSGVRAHMEGAPVNIKALSGALEAQLKACTQSSDCQLLADLLTLVDELELIESFGRVEDFDALHEARSALEVALARELRSELEDLLLRLRPRAAAYSVADMGCRALIGAARHLLVGALLDAGEAEAAAALTEQAYGRAANMTELLGALRLAAYWQLDCLEDLAADFRKRANEHPLIVDLYFAARAGAPHQSTVEVIRALCDDPAFDRGNPNRVRALLGSLALRNPVALHRADGQGYELLSAEIAKLVPVNDMVAASLITPLLSFRRFDKARAARMRACLEELSALPKLGAGMREKLDAALKAEE